MKSYNLKETFGFFLNPKYRYLFHVIFWLIVFAGDINALVENKGMYDPSCILIVFALELAIVYINIYLLFPKMLVKGQLFKYTFATLITIAVYVAVNHHFFFTEDIIEIIDEKTGESEFFPVSATTSFIAYFFRMFSIIGTAIGIKLFKRYFNQQKKIHAIKQDSLENELLYLKHQINPHFLFNSLNNIYVLSKKNLNTTSDSILLLSDLLRYQLYDCAKNEVVLQSEIEYLRNFLKLEQIRKKTSDINLEVNGLAATINISPFIFMPFVENAIKYSSMTESPKVHIKFDIQKNIINFNVINNKTDQYTNFNKDNDSGIGLSNVKRRLDLLYPNAHELICNDTPNTYEVSLKLIIDQREEN